MKNHYRIKATIECHCKERQPKHIGKTYYTFMTY